MSNSMKYIIKYQKENTVQINLRLSKKFDTDILEHLEGLDEGKATYLKRLIREDMERMASGAQQEDLVEEYKKETGKMAGEHVRAVEIAVMIGTSVPTINAWYRFKKENPDNEYAKLLPDFERHGAHNERCWRAEDVEKLIYFKSVIPQGRNGIMGSVTQKYVKKNRKDAA